ncbi:class II aldolase/adducin family protein [Pseudonocardia thermophila]|jgi:Ribulose-5-phosphate 4-epimerase and related epimerases and aldolases|uniref:class II aldolase/adducin family protein n=1 Tax=Pseudonocardia thermophila TaxID=1848 RepID=UPI00248E2346|nr:class II aldolase/adducin family protein [Pseudonocardia thermophila]
MAEPPRTMVFAEPPTFGSVEEERLDRKQRLAVALRAFARFGFDMGVAGHITARDPEFPDRFWVNPFGMHFGLVRASDLILVDHEGQVLAGDGILNTAAFRIHSEIHAARPDVVAAAHAHSVYGTAWSALDRPLLPLTNESCMFFEDHVLHTDHTGVTLEELKAKVIAQNLGPHRAAVLRNHGVVTVGRSVDEAAWWFITFEHCCRVQLLAEAAGDVVPAEPEDARVVRDTMGTPRAAWFSFQPLYQLIVREQPDVLE